MVYDTIRCVNTFFSFEVIDMAAIWTTLDHDHIIKLYAEGIGVNGIAKQLGVSPRPIERVLKERGVALRNAAAQQQARMDRSSPEERKALAFAAQSARRGQRDTMETRLKRAESFQTIQRHISAYEVKAEAMFLQRGLVMLPQKAIGPYNCDFAIDAVAVEIFGGHYHWTGAHLARSEERIRYILNAGWNLVMLAVNKNWPLTPEVADYTVSLINNLRREPPAICEYRVVWGAGDFEVIGSADDDKISIKPPFTKSRDGGTGRYQRISR